MGQWIGNEPIPNRTPPDLFAGDGVTNTFNLTYYPGTTDNIDVEISGVPQRINSYSVNGKQLILAEAPPAPDTVTEGDFNIQVKYRGPVAQHTAIWENAPIAPNSGSANAILANYSPAIASLTANLLVYVILSASNTIAAPTFSPNGLPAKTVVDYDGNALKVGALKGTVLLRYDQTTDKFWVAGSVGGASLVTARDTLIGATPTPNIETAASFAWTLSANSTLNFPVVSVPASGAWYIDVTVDNIGGYTLSFAAGYNKVYGYYFDCLPNAVYRLWLVSRNSTIIDVNIERIQ